MKKLYEKSEIWFAVIWIIVYAAGSSLADQVSQALGMEKVATLIFDAILIAAAVVFIRRNHLAKYYGLCRADLPAARFACYLPLAVLASVNLWFGVDMHLSAAESVCYVLSMLCVGFLEELIFRGFLFRAMSRDNVKSAMLVSSLTFGIGHIVNLINGSGAQLTENLCQVCYAIALGLLFVVLFYRGKSLWPCIITHGVLNALGCFADNEAADAHQVAVSLIVTAVALGYAAFLQKTIPESDRREA